MSSNPSVRFELPLALVPYFLPLPRSTDAHGSHKHDYFARIDHAANLLQSLQTYCDLTVCHLSFSYRRTSSHRFQNLEYPYQF